MSSIISTPSKLQASLRGKSVALGSGKGGVGKSTTAVNLAIYYARKGLRVAIFDLDPLSDIATLLDLTESEQTVKASHGAGLPETLAEAALPVFPNLDLVFADLKLGSGDSSRLREAIQGKYLEDLVDAYDLIIFDLPAGTGYDENLVFTQDVGRIVVVTNTEPTAHVAAGAYIREILALDRRASIRIWHNKYAVGDIGFDPRNVVGNYNRNVAEDDRLPETTASILEDIGFIPADPSMDLLQTEPSVSINIQRRLEDLIEFLHHERAASLAKDIPAKTYALMQFYLARHKRIGDVEVYLHELGAYIASLATGNHDSGKNQAFSTEEQGLLHGFFSTVKGDRMCIVATRLLEMLDRSITSEENNTRMFFAGTPLKANKAIDRDISLLLQSACSKEYANVPVVRNIAGVLLFYFAVYKLLQSPTVIKLISDFIPVRKGSRGGRVRDKRAQIRNLIEQQESYRRKYFQLIKTLYPVVNRQIATVIKTFDLQSLALRDSSGVVNREAYVKLMTDFVHDAVHGGLGVIAGFRHRPAASAFRDAAERLLADLSGSSVHFEDNGNGAAVNVAAGGMRG